MRPHVSGDDANTRARLNRTRGRRPRPEVTFRSFVKAALARLRALLAARHAGDDLDETLGEQVTLPAAFPGPAEDDVARRSARENQRLARKSPPVNGR